MRKLAFLLMIAAVSLSVVCVGWCQAAPPSQVVDVKAEIKAENSISVTISKVVGKTWTPNQPSVDFGMLTYDVDNKIFTANCYYAVDVSVSSNLASWGVKHVVLDPGIALSTDSGQTLNGNINVTFVKHSDTLTPVQLAKLSLTNSNGKICSKSEIGASDGYWLRIYYGIATGVDDAPDVATITSEKPAGKYSGQIQVTLVSN